jgi:CHAT domain-containing protein
VSAYVVDWCAGPNAQIELFRGKSTEGLQFKYTPPFRSTLRPPVSLIPIYASDLAHASRMLRELTQGVARGARDVEPAPRADTVHDMESLGGLLYDLVIADSARHDLRLSDCFVDFGIEEAMLHFPWELMHDGDEFICLKHSFGRFVSSAPQSLGPANPMSWLGNTLPHVSVLLISVPQPSAAPGAPYLHFAEQEAATIQDSLARIGNVEIKVLAGADATTLAVAKAVRTRRYHIIHFCGHARYDSSEPTRSALSLWDGELTAGIVRGLFVRAQPVVCVFNACETARLPDEGALDVYSLARAVLETGAYLVGSRWKVDDHAASCFAASFYQSLLDAGAPLGTAVRAGRQAARSAPGADPFSWSAYMLYGDPRLCFRRL